MPPQQPRELYHSSIVHLPSHRAECTVLMRQPGFLLDLVLAHLRESATRGRSTQTQHATRIESRHVAAGTHAVTALGWTSTRNLFFFSRSPPSSSYRILRLNFTSTERPLVTCTNGDLLAWPGALRRACDPTRRSRRRFRRRSRETVVRLSVVERLHSSEDFPDVAERTTLVWPSYQSFPSTSISASNGGSRGLAKRCSAELSRVSIAGQGWTGAAASPAGGIVPPRMEEM
jgi:hypothetical protein